jgi:replicative DNA helicase Mcm
MTDCVTFWKDFLKTKCKKGISAINRDYPNVRSLTIDYKEVEKSGKEGLVCADKLLEKQREVFEEVNDALITSELIKPKTKDGKPVNINIRFISVPRRVRIRDIRKENVNQLVSIDGVIIRSSEVRPRIVDAVFKCAAGHFTHRIQKFGGFVQPDKCSICNLRVLDLVPLRSIFADSQTGRIQENLETQKAGEQPQQLPIDIEDDLCGQIVPGERVVLNGIIRSRQKIQHGEKSGMFELFLQVNSIERDHKNFADLEISEEEEDQIRKLAKSPDLLTMMSKSILPAISGFAEEKKGIALFLFAAHQEAFEGKKMRGSIHVFLGGDPGISKSTMLLMLRDITPRSLYISGRSTSSAGLTFTMRQDEHDKRWVADAGAAVMADESCLFVDELGQMEKTDIMALNEFMETQIIPVNKAGINATLQARCSVMVALNPKHGRFDMAIPLADQIDGKIPPQLLSRFDLIYLLPDVPEENQDRTTADSILAGWQRRSRTRENQIPRDLLLKYIAIARQRKNPQLNEPAARLITDRFVEIRKSSGGGTISLTNRALESLARLATAHAIMRLGTEVTIQDAEAAIAVYEYSLKQFAVDSRTGMYDADRASGKTKERRGLVAEILAAIRDEGGKCSLDIIIRDVTAKNPGMTEAKVKNTFEQMCRENMLCEAGLGKWRVV